MKAELVFRFINIDLVIGARQWRLWN